MEKLYTTPGDFPQESRHISENQTKFDISFYMNTDDTFHQDHDISQIVTSKMPVQYPTIKQDIHSKVKSQNSTVDEAHSSILADSQSTLDVMTIQSEHQFGIKGALRKLDEVTIQVPLNSEESSKRLLMYQGIKHASKLNEGVAITDDIHGLSNASSQKLPGNRILPTSKTQYSQTEKENYEGECFLKKTSIPVFKTQETTLAELTDHEKFSTKYVKRKDFQTPQETLNPLNSIIETCNEEYTIIKLKIQDSEDIDFKTLVTESACNEIFYREFNASTDLTQSNYIRNKHESPHDTHSSFKKIMTPPLPMSRTSDTKEFVCIIFIIILVVLAFGVFYVLQGFKTTSNTIAALGSLGGGIILLLLFSCLYHIIKNDELYCLRKHRSNV